MYNDLKIILGKAQNEIQKTQEALKERQTSFEDLMQRSDSIKAKELGDIFFYYEPNKTTIAIIVGYNHNLNYTAIDLENGNTFYIHPNDTNVSVQDNFFNQNCSSRIPLYRIQAQNNKNSRE